MNKLTVTANNTTMASMKHIAAKLNLTVEEAASEMMERGAKDFIYRSKRNAAKWEQAKADKARLETLENLLLAEKAKTHPDTYTDSEWDHARRNDAK